MKIESLKFIADWIWRAYVFNLSVNLQPVVVHNYAQVVQLAVSGKHRCFPYLPFLNLAVSEQRIDTVAVIAELCGKRHADSHGNPLPQRAGRSVNAWRMLYAWVALQMGADMAQRRQVFHREKSPVCKCRI